MLHTILVQEMKTLQFNRSIKLKKELRWVEYSYLHLAQLHGIIPLLLSS